MGIEYELFKPEKNERYDLGKGMWSAVFTFDKGKDFKITRWYKDDFKLYCQLLSRIAFGFDLNMQLSYFNNLAKDIFKWCGDDVLHFHDMDTFNDLYWTSKHKSYDDHEKKYPYTGSRFKGDS